MMRRIRWLVLGLAMGVNGAALAAVHLAMGQILDRGSSATHSSHAASQRANISLIDRRSRWPRRVPYPAIEHCNSPAARGGQDQLVCVDKESHINVALSGGD